MDNLTPAEEERIKQEILQRSYEETYEAIQEAKAALQDALHSLSVAEEKLLGHELED